MATLVKTGIGDGQTLTPVHITELYDAFTGDKLFDNIILNNSMKVTHDGKVSISRPGFSKATPYALNVDGDIQGNVGRFTSIISDDITFVTSSGLIVSGSNHFGGLTTHIHTFTGSLAVSGSQAISNYFLNKVAIGRDEVIGSHMLQVVGGVDVSTHVSSSDLHVTQTGSIARLGVGIDVPAKELQVKGEMRLSDTTGNGTIDISAEGTTTSHYSAFFTIDDTGIEIGNNTSSRNLALQTDNTDRLVITGGGKIGIGTQNPSKELTVAGAISASGNLEIDGVSLFDGDITGSSNLNIAGTASFAHIQLSNVVSISTASMGEVSISGKRFTINNETGSDSQLIKTVDGVVSYDWADRTSIFVKNVSGRQLDAGAPVYITSYVGDDIYGVDLADATVEDRQPVAGITIDDMEFNESGSVITSGLARSKNLNTSTFTAGQKLYLSNDDILSASKPTLPGASTIVVGFCLKSAATYGEILIVGGGGGGGGSGDILKLNNIFLGSGSLTENIHLSGALDRTTVNDITGVGTASFGHLIINGNITASGTVRADAFESVTGGTSVDFNDSINITGNLTASGNLSVSGNISGSLSSTGSFGYGLFDQRVGIGIKDPSSILHISGTDGLIIPVGTDAQRSSAPKQGEIRFNRDQSTYEGYDGDNWGSLGGMNDVDGDTKIQAETSAGADNDQLQFFTAGVERLRILADGHISASGNITSSGNLEIRGNISSSISSTGSFGRVEGNRLSVNTPVTTSTAISTNNITNGYPTSNPWQTNLEGSFFNNFTPESHVSEILRFMAGVISHSIDTAAPTANTRFWNTVTTTHTQGSTTSKSSLLNGVLGSTYENARLSAHWTASTYIDMSETGSYRKVQKYLETKGWLQSSDRGSFGNDTGTNPFHGSYASRIPSTIQTNGSFDTLSHTISANAGGSSAIGNSSNHFNMGELLNGGANPYTVRIIASQSFSDNYADDTPDKTSTFHTSSRIDYTQSSFGTSNGLTLAKINTSQPAVIPAAFQDGDFNSVAGPLSGRYHHTGSQVENTISASGYYQMQDIRVGLKTGSMSDFQYKDGTDSTNRFYLYTGDLPNDITDGAPTAVVSGSLKRTGFSATSRSLSGAPYLLTTKINYDYYSESSRSFDPAYAYATTVLQNTTSTDNWETIGSSTLSTSTVNIDSNGVATAVTSGLKRGVFSSDKSIQRADNDIPHIYDLAVCSSSLSMSLDSSHNNVVQNRSSQESLNYTLAIRATAKNWKNSSATSTSPTQNFYVASLFGQPSSSGSMAIYSFAQGYDTNTLADSTETFTGEDFRIVLADNVQAFNGAYFTTDSYKTNDNGDAVLGNFDLQVKPGYLVDPGGTKGYWFPSNFGSGTYKYYIRRFQKTSSGTKTSMTLNLGTTLVAWNSTSNGVSAVILFESSGNGSGNNVSLSRARIYDPTATTSNVIETNISNDNHKNPFSTAIDLYGNTGGDLSSTTYTMPIRNADGMFLDDSDNQLYVIVRYKSDPTPITSITLGYS